MIRLRAAALLLVAGGALGWVVVAGLGDNLVYYRTPSELLEQEGELRGSSVRLGGVVVPGSRAGGRDDLRFAVTDGTAEVVVVGAGGVPSLFREGQGVVVEGVYEGGGRFRADTVLVKHGSVYRPPDPGETPTTAELEEG